MSKKNPVEKSIYIKEKYKEYLKSSFRFGNETLQKNFEEQLEKENLFKGPYVSLELPFERGVSLNKLIEEGIVAESFSELSNLQMDRPLYAHQEKAIKRIGSGRGAIVTTGTGSGKTESFLFPILNEILFDIEAGKNDAGIRAIFLYPMNALVNDQLERIRKLLQDYPQITYGFFTGETKESVPDGYREKQGQKNGYIIPPNELVSREEIRENPPHLLFTNYSMLEYLLIRPNDYALFTPEKLQNWKFVVLDEAHSYYGSLGIELSLLMRRLTGMAESKPRFILTSATLGEKGISEPQIIDFAKKLTSTQFDESDIIFSDRIDMKKTINGYRVAGADYLYLHKNIKEPLLIKDVMEKYGVTSNGILADNLFQLLSNDENVYDIYLILKDKSKTVSNVLSQMGVGLSTEELIALIDLINLAEHNGIGLFDLKYHSFVRPIAGAYITLGENQQLSLTKTNNIKDQKVFEIGNCKHCNAPYIIGRIRHSKLTDLDYLLQNSEVDIYENYGENEHVQLDYFILEDFINDEEVDSEMIDAYCVCSSCGAIHAQKNLKAKKCDCGNEYQKIIYRVQRKKTDDTDAFNNINQCPCCGHKSKSGIVKSLNLGKDEGTALIAQMLLEAIDETTEATKKSGGLSLKKTNAPKTENVSKVKQFLAFSDSRQQASFAATFLESNHVRMLQKRIIWETIKDVNYNSISVDELAARLTAVIKDKELFANNLTPQQNAWATIMIDLLRVDGAYDGQGLGLYHFDLNLNDIMEQLDDEDVEDAFGKYGVNKSNLESLIQVILSAFKIAPAINYVKSTLSEEHKRDYLEYRRFSNYVKFSSEKRYKNVKTLLPLKGDENSTVRYVKKACNCSSEEAKEIIDIIFNNLIVVISEMEGKDKFLIKSEKNEGYQIDVGRYIIKNYRNTQYYQCSKCGTLTPYNVNNCCTQDRCDGKLVEVDPDEALAMNYYREQYKNKKIERIVVKEHTAQLNKNKAREYQQQFKDKKINILSCSTTFEMGIDIGDLETVYMRNVPPTPANYVQRAGRAGRRKDSAAYVLTYCSTGSHDYTYFEEPEKMICGVINPPYFNVENRKIIIRHLMASCLGFFFRRYPDYFKSIDELVFNGGIAAFNKYIESCPEDLNSYINEKVLPEALYKKYHDFKWFVEMGGQDEKMMYFEECLRNLEKEYGEAKEAAVKAENYKDADYFARQIENVHKGRVIDSLSKFCVIPKYGFPVDVVNLHVYDNEGKLNSSLDLNRDLKIAISEYAPDSEVIVDGTKYTSKYISLPRSGELPKQYFCTCPKCNRVNVFVSHYHDSTCKYCGEDIDNSRIEYYIEPVNGFKTGETKESTRMKPKRTYSGEVLYLGGGKKDDVILNIDDIISIETSSDDELLIMNRSEFYMCPTCGYSEKVKNKIPTEEVHRPHINYHKYQCSNETLIKLKIGHRFKTDVARIQIPSLSAVDQQKGFAKAMSFMYAFLEGVSKSFGIERTDIDGVLDLNLERGSYDVLLYDNVPGGAGHTKRLMDKDAIINALKESLAKVSQKCCDEDTSCYNCLRNYYNQKQHGILKRSYAKQVIQELLKTIS